MVFRVRVSFLTLFFFLLSGWISFLRHVDAFDLLCSFDLLYSTCPILFFFYLLLCGLAAGPVSVWGKFPIIFISPSFLKHKDCDGKTAAGFGFV